MRRNAMAATFGTALLTLVLSLLIGVPSSSVPAARAATTYTPVTGVMINNPLGTTAQKRKILDHLIRSIDAAPTHSTIRVATWNLRSNAFVDALLRAHRRYLSVRFTMDGVNASAQKPNPQFDRLVQGLQLNNATRPAAMQSFARKCGGSCRGPSGLSHTKMYLISKSGNASNVAMFGSVNATDLAANWQWNDLATIVNDTTVYTRLTAIFDEMVLDKPVASPYHTFGIYGRKVTVFPHEGPWARTPDPVMDELNKIWCQGAVNAGVNGKTSIRIAMTAMTDQRGINLAYKLKDMYNRGCNIRIIYAMFGKQVLGILRSRSGRGPIPVRQIAQDFNKDCVYDRYLHTKVMAVSGVYDGNKSANVTWMGSANWTYHSLHSDEVGARLSGPWTRQHYATWINNLFEHPPSATLGTCTAGAERMAVGTDGAAPITIDPYADMEIN